jgi:hypothetical protein
MNSCALSYTEDWLQVDRPQPLSDLKIEKTFRSIINGDWNPDVTDQVYEDFILECENWIFSTKLNTLTGIKSFTRKDIIIGCTQFIDNLYMQGPIQVLRGDYRYHQRLGLAYVKDVGSLIPDIPLIIAMPFPSIGAPHQDMEEILHECKIKNIAVHIDGAWISCCRNINFNFDHASIRSVGISLSKGLGLGWNRIGLRWTKEEKADAITIMNDFKMNCRPLSMVGLQFIRMFETDYLWNTYGTLNERVCKDFGLEQTNSIYLALKDKQPVGIAPLIRYLAENE